MNLIKIKEVQGKKKKIKTIETMSKKGKEENSKK